MPKHFQPRISDTVRDEIRRRLQSGEHPLAIADQCGVSRAFVYERLSECTSTFVRPVFRLRDAIRKRNMVPLFERVCLGANSAGASKLAGLPFNKATSVRLQRYMDKAGRITGWHQRGLELTHRDSFIAAVCANAKRRVFKNGALPFPEADVLCRVTPMTTAERAWVLMASMGLVTRDLLRVHLDRDPDWFLKMVRGHIPISTKILDGCPFLSYAETYWVYHGTMP